ncbi:hypothetical protein ACJX0J_022242 [Zea mays]
MYFGVHDVQFIVETKISLVILAPHNLKPNKELFLFPIISFRCSNINAATAAVADENTIFPSAADGHAIFSETWDMRTIGDRNKEEKSKEGNGQDNVNIGVELGMFWIMILNNLCGEIMEENLFGIFLLRNKEDGIHRMGTEYGGNTAIERWQGWAKNTSGSNKKEKKEIIQKLDLLDKRAETCMLSTQEVDMLASMLREEETDRRYPANHRGGK